jgi:hypothetical protein
MPNTCNRQWSEDVEVETRNPHRMRLNHACIRAAGHQDGPCRCACDPIPELREDFQLR